MSKLKPWLLLAVIFIAGAVAGSALTIGLASHFMHPPGARQMQQNWMERLTERLKLTADQQAKIEPIVTDAGNEMQAVHKEEVGRISQIILKANSQIEAFLTPEQLAEMQAMEKEHHMKSWGFHGDHDGKPFHDHPPGDMPPPPPASPSTNAPPR